MAPIPVDFTDPSVTIHRTSFTRGIVMTLFPLKASFQTEVTDEIFRPHNGVPRLVQQHIFPEAAVIEHKL